MSNVVVVGGCGFIGSHLSLMLCKDNDVTVFDKASLPAKLKGKVKFVKGDIRDLAILEDVLSLADTVYHLAAQISVPKSFVEPYYDFSVNALGSINVAEACVKNKVKNLVVFSSAAVFGDNPNVPLSEDAETKPLSPYGDNKLFAEKYIGYIKKDVTFVRPFNVYGKGQDPANSYSGVISKFIDMARNGQDLIIFGDGKQTRDFVNVGDLCRAVIKVTGISGTFNVGCGKSVSINELAETVNGLFGLKSKVVYVDAREGDILHSCADVSKLRSVGWGAEIALKDGLKEMI
ncbi:MAG: NAD-dependent epimerase/dehydratase family protein [DPANN group archaeon]|nr:NAD-dependent epimerase/dehydratase family protein [DPANN group archaeon]